MIGRGHVTRCRRGDLGRSAGGRRSHNSLPVWGRCQRSLAQGKTPFVGSVSTKAAASPSVSTSGEAVRAAEMLS